MEDRNCRNPRQFLLMGQHTDLLGLTTTDLQCQGSRLKDIRDIRGGTELSRIRVGAGGADFS